jgi:peroxiredoxin
MRRSPDPILLLLLATSLGTNVFLYRHHTPVRAVEPLRVGQQVPELVATSLDGDLVRFRFDKPAVLYVFSPSCIWCERNLENARHLAMDVRGKYEFIAIASDSNKLREYLDSKHLSWRVLTDVPQHIRTAYRIAGTPQTIVVGTGGKVLHVWPGAYRGNIADEIERTFGIKLPGIKG